MFSERADTYAESRRSQKNDEYEIFLSGNMASRTDIVHELCHIQSGDLERKKNILIYKYFEEPRATFCEWRNFKRIR